MSVRRHQPAVAPDVEVRVGYVVDDESDATLALPAAVAEALRLLALAEGWRRVLVRARSAWSVAVRRPT
ncbi:hypothetical protein WME88_02310 [Sorangium sp. So ce216]